MIISDHITKQITLEDLVGLLPDAVGLLNRKGIRCLACGEPTEGTLEGAAKEKGYSDDEITLLVQELNELL